MRTISLKLPEDLLVELEREAKARRITKSEVIRDGLRKTLREKKNKRSVSCYDLTADLVGSLKGLPKDLATNPDYMEGFGR